MADAADVKATVGRAFGLPWRTGEIAYGDVFVMDRSGSLITNSAGSGSFSDDFSSSEYDVTTEAYELSGGSWDLAGEDVPIKQTSTDGQFEFKFTPPDNEIYRLVFTVTGDYEGRTEVTIPVKDSTADESAESSRGWNQSV